MTDLFCKAFTIYNVLPKSAAEGPSYGHRRVVKLCAAQGGTKLGRGASAVVLGRGTSALVLEHAISFYTKDTAPYLPPHLYYALPPNKRCAHYTLAAGDFIVFAEVPDEINHALGAEFTALKAKYAAQSMTVSEPVVFLNGMATDYVGAISV